MSLRYIDYVPSYSFFGGLSRSEQELIGEILTYPPLLVGPYSYLSIGHQWDKGALEEMAEIQLRHLLTYLQKNDDRTERSKG